MVQGWSRGGPRVSGGGWDRKTPLSAQKRRFSSVVQVVQRKFFFLPDTGGKKLHAHTGVRVREECVCGGMPPQEACATCATPQKSHFSDAKRHSFGTTPPQKGCATPVPPLCHIFHTCISNSLNCYTTKISLSVTPRGDFAVFVSSQIGQITPPQGPWTIFPT